MHLLNKNCIRNISSVDRAFLLFPLKQLVYNKFIVVLATFSDFRCSLESSIKLEYILLRIKCKATS